MIFGIVRVMERDTCVGISSEKYRGRTVRCSNLPARKSKYCEEHKPQGKWGLKSEFEGGDKDFDFFSITLIFFVSASLLFLYLGEKFFDRNNDVTTLELIYIELLCCLPILYMLLSPVKCKLTRNDVDIIEEEKAQEKRNRDLMYRMWGSKISNLPTTSRRRPIKNDEGDDANDVGDWGSGLGDGKGPSDDDADDDDDG